MNPLIARILSAIATAVWGVVLCYFYFSGRVASYLHPAFHIYTVICGVTLLLMAGGLLILPLQHACADGEVCDHDKPPGWLGGSLAFVILIVPLLVATVQSPSQFSATTVLNRGFVESVNEMPSLRAPFTEPRLPGEEGAVADETTQGVLGYFQRNEHGDMIVEMADLMYAAEDPGLREDFVGKNVELTGQFMPATTNNPQGNRFRLVRMFVVCCAADARPLALTVQDSGEVKFPDMSWVKVRGTVQFPVEGGRVMPLIVAQEVSETEPPEETFVY